MANTIKKPAAAKRTAKAAPGKTRAKDVAPSKAEAAETTRATQIAANALAKLPVIDDADRAAFEKGITLAACLKVAGGTRAAGVVVDAAAWIPKMAAEVAKANPKLNYAPKRLTHYCESVLALGAALAAAEASRGATVGARDAAIAERAAARDSHDDLARKIESVVDGDAEAEKALSAARDATRTDDGLASALTRLAAMTSALLDEAATDATTATLVAEAHLVKGDAALALTRRKALVDATTKKTEAGAARNVDPPEVSPFEGKVGLLMRVAWKRFNAARRQSPDVAALPLGASTKHILTKGSSAKKPPADPPPDGTGGPGTTAPVVVASKKAARKGKKKRRR